MTITVNPYAGYAPDELTIIDSNGRTVSFVDNGDAVTLTATPDPSHRAYYQIMEAANTHDYRQHKAE